MFIVGRVCSGKSTLIEALEKRGLPVSKQSLSKLVQHNNIFENQLQVMQHLGERKYDAHTFYDRHISEAQIFNTAAHALQLIDDKQFQTLSEAYAKYRSAAIVKDEETIVMLEAPAHVL